MLLLGIPTSRAAGQPTTRPSDSPPGKPLAVYFFYSPTCPKCAEATKTVNAVERQYGPKIRIERMNVLDRKSFELLLDMEDKYSSNEGAPPKVFVGKQYLAGLDAISKRLSAVVAEELARQDAAATSQPTTAPAATTAPAGVSVSPTATRPAT